MWKAIRDREAASLAPLAFSRRVFSTRLASLHLSNRKDLLSLHRGAVNSLQVDPSEGRYLLSGASDGSAAVFDTHQPTRYEAPGLVAHHHSLFHLNAHKFAVSSAVWYPIDTGLFITASFDHYVKLWDTNSTQVVLEYRMPAKVYAVAMSPIATTHTLIATGTADVQVRLCDLASGAFTHTLSGHRGRLPLPFLPM